MLAVRALAVSLTALENLTSPVASIGPQYLMHFGSHSLPGG